MEMILAHYYDEIKKIRAKIQEGEEVPHKAETGEEVIGTADAVLQVVAAIKVDGEQEMEDELRKCKDKYENEKLEVRQRYINDKRTKAKAAWDELVGSSSVDSQQWRLTSSPSAPMSPMNNEHSNTAGGFFDTMAQHSALGIKCAPTSRTHTTSESEPTAKKKLSICDESGKELCTIVVRPGDSLALIRCHLANISQSFRFLKASGNPVAMKMEERTQLEHEQHTIVLRYV